MSHNARWDIESGDGHGRTWRIEDIEVRCSMTLGDAHMALARGVLVKAQIRAVGAKMANTRTATNTPQI
jgi:hypothetical protein